MEVDDTTAFDEPNMDVYHAVDIIWIFFCLVLVTLMQPGFACYEVGAISGTTSTSPILLKNVGDASVSLVAWLLLGYGLASGEDRGGVIGTSFFAFTGGAFAETAEQSAAMAFLLCLYQWSFAAACTTIISGAVADRIPFKAYLIYAFLTSGVFYPLLAHWVWADGGWASASSSAPLFGCGVLDFAGSGVVHMCGGGIGLIMAKIVRPRIDRFLPGNPATIGEIRGGGNLKNHTNDPQINEADFRSNDMAWMTLGGFLLWIGWYGFNCGSTLGISTAESQRTAGRAAMNTTVAAAFGCIFSMIVELVYHVWSPSFRHGDDIEDPLHRAQWDWDANVIDEEAGAETLQMIKVLNGDEGIVERIRRHRQAPGANFKNRVLKSLVFFNWPYSTHKNLHGAAVNGILAGLVGITAGCATMSYGSAVWVSFVSVLLYHVSYRVFICLKIDDAVGAGAIHFVCGLWGLIAAGFTATEDARLDAGYPSTDECSSVSQLSANAVLAGTILLYAPACTIVLWIPLWGLGLTKQVIDGVWRPRPQDEDLVALKAQVVLQNAANYDEFDEMRGYFEQISEQAGIVLRKRKKSGSSSIRSDSNHSGD